MITSMTGFGRGEMSDDGIIATVEIKSLNSRFLDLNIRLPQKFQDKELQIKELIQNSISRGKLNVSVHLDLKSGDEAGLNYDKDKVKAYASVLKEISEIADLDNDISLRTLLSFSDIFSVQDDEDEKLEKAWKLIFSAAEEAIENLNKMRRQEGNQLETDLQERIQSIESELVSIQEKSENRIPQAKQKLLDRINNLMDDDNFDEDRLELEVAIIVDKMDITEEIVRLKSHLKFFMEAIQEGALMGRRLNFLTQEMNRELNTIGSKANNSDIAHHVVRSKESLEQIREQVQNIE